MQRAHLTNSGHHYILLHTLETLLRHYPSSHSPLIATRLMKSVLPSISKMLVNSDGAPDFGVNGSSQSKSKKGKKKAQSYEGDELFSAARPVVYPTDVDAKVLLKALEGMSGPMGFSSMV